MKVFIFRCRSRPGVQAASRYETGSNLPRNECSDGWLFSESVDLKTERRMPRLGVNIAELRLHVQEQGYHVWGGSAPVRASSEVAVAPPPFATASVEPVVVSPALDPPRYDFPAPAAEAPVMAAAAASDGTVATPPRHQVVWFDIPVRDLDRAIRFYSAVLGVLLRKEQAG